VKGSVAHIIPLIFFLILPGLSLFAQRPSTQRPTNILRDIGGRIPGAGGPTGSGGGGGGISDSLRARNKHEDSVTVIIRYLDSTG
jgi:hypothetical protein